jgi:hypothetical protein
VHRHNIAADNSATISNYYNYAIGLIEQANSQMTFVIHDAFLSLYEWTSFANPNGLLDTHHYEGSNPCQLTLTAVFGADFALQGQITEVCRFGTTIASIEGTISTVVGEFTGAQTDCISHCRSH